MNKKNVYITLGITFFLFTFILFLLYIIYCFAYYDKYQEETFVTKFNSGSYDYVYQNIRDNKGLGLENFNIPIKLMYDKNNLKEIYYTYYNSSSFENLDDFIDTYYFKNIDISMDDILFESVGKTGFFNRRKLYYSSIKVESKNGKESSLGIKNNISIKIEDNSKIYLDDNELDCLDSVCGIEFIFGGLHEIKYISNGHEYYGLLNIIKNEQVIDVTTVDSLIKVSTEIVDNEDKVSVSDYNLKIGRYKLSSCYLDSGCPTKSKSYIQLNYDNTCVLYTYISLDQAGDMYVGTYNIEGNFLVMNFDSHTYRMFDYDTKQASDIVGRVDMEIRYKIESDYVISNDSYKFKFAE